MSEAVWHVVAILLGIALILAIIYIVRLRLLYNRAGSFEVAVRKEGSDRWRTGIALFRPQQILWYDTRGIRMRANHTWSRDGLDFEISPSTGGDVQVVKLIQHGNAMYLATTTGAVSGIVSWMDSAPPIEEPELF